jgi:hypothetical protein
LPDLQGMAGKSRLCFQGNFIFWNVFLCLIYQILFFIFAAFVFFSEFVFLLQFYFWFIFNFFKFLFKLYFLF